MAYFAYTSTGKRVSQEDVDKYEHELKEVYEEIYANLLDDVFQDHSKIPRADFISKLALDHPKYLDHR